MARVQGLLSQSIYEAAQSKPLDARMLVTKYEDLINPESWIPLGKTYSTAFNGMLVGVSESSHEGIYYLRNRYLINSSNFNQYKDALASGDPTQEFFKAWVRLADLESVQSLEKRVIDLENKEQTGVTEETVRLLLDQLKTEILDSGVALKTDVDTLTSKVDEIDSKVVAVDNKLNALTPEINTIKVDIDSLKTQVGESHGSVAVKSRNNLPTVGSVGIVYIIEEENAAYRWDRDQLKYYSIGRDYTEIQVIYGGTAG